MTGHSVPQQIIVGEGTHKDIHVAAAVGMNGRLLHHRHEEFLRFLQRLATGWDGACPDRSLRRVSECRRWSGLGVRETG